LEGEAGPDIGEPLTTQEQMEIEQADNCNLDVSDEELGDWEMIEYEEAATNLSV